MHSYVLNKNLLIEQETAPKVKKLVQLGINDRQIAKQIGINSKTVKKARLYS